MASNLITSPQEHLQLELFKHPKKPDTRHRNLTVGIFYELRERKRNRWGWRAHWAENGERRRKWFNSKRDAALFLMGKEEHL